ncbi:MAG: molybdopterin-binding protein [Pseudomonadota bacterium]
MRFGPVRLAEAVGSVLGHALTGAQKRYKKGHVLTQADVKDLGVAGHTHIIVATLDSDDIGEDEAARQLADAILSDHGLPDGARHIEAAPAFTGRVNFHATRSGLFTAHRGRIDGLNAVDPAITLATLPDGTFVEAGRMVATVKIIPFAVAHSALARAAVAGQGADGLPVMAIHPPLGLSVAHVSTQLPTLKPSVMDKTRRTLKERLEPLAGVLLPETRVEHSLEAVAAALHAVDPAAGLIVLFGASAITDPNDVLPSALRAAGGHVDRVGMPVDPGNLLMVGRLGDVPVIGAPGCARSSAENGFDWVLQRLACGLPVDNQLIARWGVGGLLMEITSRPQPRETVRSSDHPSAGAPADASTGAS